MSEWHLARGYLYAGVHSGLRPDPQRLDLALVVSDRPATAAGVFTQNRVCAAPVRVCRERVPRTDARGIVICSGNANACTGSQGLRDAYRMTECAAQAIGCRPEQMLVCSTGVIGRLLPMAIIEPGIAAAAAALSADVSSLERVARAILTTDTCIKVSTRRLNDDIALTGFAKGAAMIGPDLATMLAFVLTDAAILADDLARIAREAAASTFNCVSVEGHTSTNDTFLLLANGSGPPLAGPALQRFRETTIAVCAELARAIAADAEGASHLIAIEVEGAQTDADAQRIAKAIADSALCKTAIFGADPNWGRFVSAAGYAGVDFAEDDLSLWLGDFLLYDQGTPAPFDAAAVSAWIKQHREITLRLCLRLGAGRCRFYTSDLTYDYVRLNAEYTT
ncbi:MAG: bifunctional glutamate N-acetyltransferase/amino-acid acetyltransferase ArgJ [Gemmataceae bacterium]|nr:bifunctional glutamate N-acetyltransferase/amino-acid acetyltransferase ArgJ [Gemmataceae bacterium]